LDIRKDILWRVYVCYIGIIFIGALVLAKTFYIQQVEGKFWRGMGDSLHLKYMPINAARGSIYSEDGNILSTSIPVFDVYVDFCAEGLRAKNGILFKENIDSLALRMSQVFGDKSMETYKNDLELAYKNKERYYLLKRKISYDEMSMMRNFPLVRLGRNKSGFIYDIRDKRINPYVLLANRTIGLSRKDSSKNVGLERTYDSLLRGETGQRLMRYASGAYMPVEGAEVDPINGKDIITTLDTYIQDVAEDELMQMMVGNNSEHGSVIVMEVATGKIKAIANLGKEKDGVYTENLNYGIGKATEPGSVFKLATLLCLLDDKYVTTDTKVDCEGGVKSFYGLKIKDSHKGTGTITVKDAFARSSNVAFAKLANQYYQAQPMKWYQHLDRFRLTKLTGIDIIATSGKPTIKSPSSKSWGKTTIPYMAHGYEELVTPLHMLMLYNSVANNGKMMKPYLVNSVKENGIEIQKFVPEVLVDKICSDDAIKQAKECLRAVVDSTHGTGYKILTDSNYSISGKTGTAVTALDNTGYNKGNKIYQSSFIGYFPSENPKYSISVVIQNNKESKQYYGALVAGKVFKKVSDRIYNHFLSKPNFKNEAILDTSVHYYFGIKTDMQSIFSGLGITYADSNPSGLWRNASLIGKNAKLSEPSELNTAQNIMPNLVGMGLKDALYLLENKGLTATISGKGKVISQSLFAGTIFKKGQKIILMLN
jgi:cell division protein FtsI (penicillin-binding protein 3)